MAGWPDGELPSSRLRFILRRRWPSPHGGGPRAPVHRGVWLAPASRSPSDHCVPPPPCQSPLDSDLISLSTQPQLDSYACTRDSETYTSQAPPPSLAQRSRAPRRSHARCEAGRVGVDPTRSGPGFEIFSPTIAAARIFRVFWVFCEHSRCFLLSTTERLYLLSAQFATMTVNYEKVVKEIKVRPLLSTVLSEMTLAALRDSSPVLTAEILTIGSARLARVEEARPGPLFRGQLRGRARSPSLAHLWHGPSHRWPLSALSPCYSSEERLPHLILNPHPLPVVQPV